MERRLTAILAADVAEYSRHTEEDDEASTAILEEHLALVRESIAAHQGQIFTLAGDGIIAEFSSVVEAVRCAIEIQNKMADRNASIPEKKRMQFRIGVNLGDVISKDNNCYGTGVNVGARLEKLAKPGGIVISQTVYDQVRKIVDDRAEELGNFHLKNIPGRVRVYRIYLAPLPLYKRALVKSKRSLQRTEVAALVLLSLVAITVLTLYILRQPAILWSTLLSAPPKFDAIAVLPFIEHGDDPELKSFSAGLKEDIETGLWKLSRSSDLRVLGYEGEATKLSDTRRDLQVRYVLEGSVQRHYGLFRVRPSLKDAYDDEVLWTETFDRKISERALVDDAIAKEIVATIAGAYGVIESKQLKSAKQKSPEEQKRVRDLVVEARDKMQEDWTDANFKAARKLLEEALELDPLNAPARTELAWIGLMGWVFEVDDQPVSQHEIAVNAISAVQLDPLDARARMVAASGYFFTKQLDRFKEERKQALKLASDPQVLAVLGALTAYTGDWKRGVSMVKEANRIRPAAAMGWYHSTMYLNDYLKGEYESALDMIRENPDFKWELEYAYLDYISICGELKQFSTDKQCEDPTAEEAWSSIVRRRAERGKPASAKTIEDWYRLWNFRDDDIEKLMDGVYKSGVLGSEAKAQVGPER